MSLQKSIDNMTVWKQTDLLQLLEKISKFLIQEFILGQNHKTCRRLIHVSCCSKKNFNL